MSMPDSVVPKFLPLFVLLPLLHLEANSLLCLAMMLVIIAFFNSLNNVCAVTT